MIDQQKEIAGFTGRLLRESFGRGPQAVYAHIGDSHALVLLHDFFSPMEKTLMEAEGEDAIHLLRETMMKDIGPKVRHYIQSVTGTEYNEFFFDWNLSNQSGILIGLQPEAYKNAAQKKEPLQHQYPHRKEVEHTIAKLSAEAERQPDRVTSVMVDKRTILIVREGILVAIEKKLISMGYGDVLKAAKRSVEKELFYRHDVFSRILRVDVKNIYVDWDFTRDKSTIVIVTEKPIKE